MPHKTLHCRDDEPLRITLAKAILAVSHTLDNMDTLDDGVITSHICQHVGSGTPPVHGPSLCGQLHP